MNGNGNGFHLERRIGNKKLIVPINLGGYKRISFVLVLNTPVRHAK